MSDDSRIDPSGMTVQELERLKAEADPTYVTEKDKAKMQLKLEQQGTDEDEMLHWIWNRMNPQYKTRVSKRELLEFLLADGDIRDVFNLKDSELVHIVESIVTEHSDALTFDEYAVSVYLLTTDLHAWEPPLAQQPRAAGGVLGHRQQSTRS